MTTKAVLTQELLGGNYAVIEVSNDGAIEFDLFETDPDSVPGQLDPMAAFSVAYADLEGLAELFEAARCEAVRLEAEPRGTWV